MHIKQKMCVYKRSH